jgi:hypothetical protein
MTEKQNYWMVDGEGKKALITGTAGRDQWLPHGLADSEEPAGTELVWCWHEGIKNPATFPAQALEAWQAKGWQPGPPPSPVSPFNGDEGAPVFPAVAPLSAPVAPAPVKSETPAAGGEKKEK